MNEEEMTPSVVAAAPATNPAPELLETKDLEVLNKIKRQAELARTNAEKTALQLQLLESQLQNVYYQLVIKYKLDITQDRIEDDGRIVRSQTTKA